MTYYTHAHLTIYLRDDVGVAGPQGQGQQLGDGSASPNRWKHPGRLSSWLSPARFPDFPDAGELRKRLPGLTLLDAHVMIHHLKGDPFDQVRIRNASHSELAIPAIVVCGLEHGTLRSKLQARRRRELEAGLEQIRHVPFDSAVAVTAASIPSNSRLQLKSSEFDPPDFENLNRTQACRVDADS